MYFCSAQCNKKSEAKTIVHREHQHPVTATLNELQADSIREAAARFYSRMASSPIPEIRLDLYGRAAGQWRLKKGIEILRFNPAAFILDWSAHFPSTVAHEVAHSLVFRRFGLKSTRPHGPEWQATMNALGFPPRVTHQTQLPGRRSRIYFYACGCRSHELGPRRHYLISRRGYQYTCAHCGDLLKFHHRVAWRRSQAGQERETPPSPGGETRDP